MNEQDCHAEELPILAQPLHALSVVQLFQLMIGESRVCHQKPVGVRYSGVFVDLSCVSSLNDIRADDNATWVHGGKPRQKYSVEFEDNNVVVDAKLIKLVVVMRMFLLLYVCITNTNILPSSSNEFPMCWILLAN